MMETSAFLYENLSYSLLIWLHFGTSMLISFSVFLYVIPILYNIVVLYLPSFKFGFKEAAAGAGSSGLPMIPIELIKTLKDSKVFAGIFSRNPKLFSAIPAEETKTFFVKLDEKIDRVLDNLKDLPTSEENEEKEETGEEGTVTDSKKQAADGRQQTGEGGRAMGKGADTVSEPEVEKGAKKSKKKKLLLYGNLVFVIVIVAINVYSYFYYSGIISDYFVVKKGMLKNSGDDYELVYGKLRGLKDSSKVELIKEINTYVEIINTVKADKRKREAAEAAKKEQEEQGKK
ncbi:MAG: hypothetical protein V1779_13860 [bacterium]